MKAMIGLIAAAGAQACLLIGAAHATVPATRPGHAAGASTVARVVPWNSDADAASVHLAQRRRSTPKEEAPRDEGPRTMAVSPCARDYHAGMTEILRSFEPSLNASLESARTVDASISGHWMFHNPALKQRMVRVCAEPSTSGPARCLKWEMRPAAATGGPMTPATPGPSEFKLIRAVEEFVRLRGLVSDLAKSGRFDGITVRVADDLTAYLSQPQHPAMCTGGAEFTDFMISNTRTYRARIQEVADTDKAARALARSRVAQLAAAARKAAEPAPPAASPAGGASTPSPTPSGEQTAAGVVPGSEIAPPTAAPAPPPAPTPRPDVSKVPPDYAGMIAELGRQIVRDGERGPADDGGTPLEQLTRIQSWLRSEAANSLIDETRAPLLLALRAIETGIYAEAMQNRYGAVSEALFGSIAKLRELHKARCTCGS